MVESVISVLIVTKLYKHTKILAMNDCGSAACTTE